MTGLEAFILVLLGVLLGAFLIHIWHDSIEDIRWWRSRPDIRDPQPCLECGADGPACPYPCPISRG